MYGHVITCSSFPLVLLRAVRSAYITRNSSSLPIILLFKAEIIADLGERQKSA